MLFSKGLLFCSYLQAMYDPLNEREGKGMEALTKRFPLVSPRSYHGKNWEMHFNSQFP